MQQHITKESFVDALKSFYCYFFLVGSYLHAKWPGILVNVCVGTLTEEKNINMYKSAGPYLLFVNRAYVCPQCEEERFCKHDTAGGPNTI